MKISEIKHDHSLTDLLKVFIFSILMLLPFLSVLTRCMYVTFNKNAYQSYSGTTTQTTATPKYQTNEINDYNDFIDGNYYELYYDTNIVFTEDTPDETTTTDIISDTGYDVIQILKYNYSLTGYAQVSYIMNNTINQYGADYITITSSVKRGNQNSINYDLLYTDDYTDGNVNSVGYLSNVRGINLTIHNVVLIKCLDFSQYKTSGVQELEDYFNSNYFRKVDLLQEYTITEIESSTLDNVFEYSFQRMSQDDMFNWTQNTALYSGIHAMTTNLQIQTNVIAILLTYWTILTIIYVIIDIVLKCFTLLTHGFSRKTS